MSEYWEAVAGFEVLRKTWGSESAIYHTGSGDTQLLDELGIAILNLVQAQRLETEEIREHILRKHKVELEGDSLARLLAELNRSGVITRVQTP
ncbi:MAG: hypothetical protein OEY52_01275 [Gammaproteobacteria bacterium]|nr:hypothetical protein [Gammaproteobacteria bacterium]